MKLTNDNYSKIKAEALEPYRHKAKLIIGDIKKELSTVHAYLSDAEIQQYLKTPNGWLPQVQSAFIPKKNIKRMGEIIKKGIEFRDFSDIRVSDMDSGIEIDLDSPLRLPASHIKQCGCDQDHGTVRLDMQNSLDAIITLAIKRDEINTILNRASLQFKTLKTLKEGLIGIEKLAPKAIAELENAKNNGSLVLATNVHGYVVS